MCQFVRGYAAFTLAGWAATGCGGGDSSNPDGPTGPTGPTPTSGSISVRATTTGENIDGDGYTVSVGTSSPVISVSGTVTVTNVPAGSNSVELADVALNCFVTGRNPRVVAVTGGQTVQVEFQITCIVPREGRLAFNTERDGNSEIYLMHSDGTGPVNLTNHPAFDANPAWSPDGSRIAFTTQRDGNLEIYVMNANGTNQVRLTNNNVVDGHPSWSPDGKRIAFLSQRPSGQFA